MAGRDFLFATKIIGRGFLDVENVQHDGRLIVGMDNNAEASVTIQKGDPEFYDNLNEVYDYKCNFRELLSITDCVKTGKDASDAIFKYINKPIDINIFSTETKGDNNGKIFSNVEFSVLKYYEFNGLVTPSKGTIFRLVRARPKEFKVGPLLIYLIQPYGYPEECSDEELEGFDRYVQEIQAACDSCQIKSDIQLVAWDDLPKNKFLYFSSNGFKMHELEIQGVGLELNLHVGVSMNTSVLSFVDCDTYYDVEYIRNMYRHQMKYYKVPKYYRVHGDFFCDVQGYSGCVVNLFNVITTRPLSTTVSREVVHDYRYAHCANRLVCANIHTVVTELFKGYNIRVGVDAYGYGVSVLSPPYELSSSVKIIKELGYDLSHIRDGINCIVSTISAKIVQVPEVFSEGECYDYRVIKIPSEWRYNGLEWKLRFFPNAHFNNGKWYTHSENGELIPNNDLYDKNLEYIGDKFMVSGDITHEYFLGRSKKMKRERHTVSVCNNSVTILKAKSKKSRKKFPLPSVDRYATRIDYSNYVVYSFRNSQLARSFYLQNVERFKTRIMMADLSKSYQFTDPKRNNDILILSKSFDYRTDMLMQETDLISMWNVSSGYDKIGNYYFDESSPYEVIYDYDDGIQYGNREDLDGFNIVKI